MKLSITSDKFTLTLPEGYIPTFEVIKEYCKLLRSLDEGEQSAVVLPVGWELDRI